MKLYVFGSTSTARPLVACSHNLGKARPARGAEPHLCWACRKAPAFDSAARHGDDMAPCRLFRHVMRARSFLPELHTAQEDLTHFRDKLFAQADVCWREGGHRRFLICRPNFIDHLHAIPIHQDRASADCLSIGKAAAPSQLELYLQQNPKAAASTNARASPRGVHRRAGTRRRCPTSSTLGALSATTEPCTIGACRAN